ncbi:MAG: 2-dehydro-3-deoxyglucarate aldolase [Chloroflexi bacterium]|nr:MAG: 2-dehydro-3-deoxyglucarate aldolase [Chloroflexota bacterium]
MRKNHAKAKIQARQPAFGVGFENWSSPDLVEFCGYLGFDWLWIDVEHGAFDLDDMAHMARAADLSGIVPVARIPHTDDCEKILGYMEAGMMGICMAHTRSREEAEFAVRAVKFPPLGVRSAGRARPARWGIGGTAAEYYEAANRESLVMVLVEEEDGLGNLEDILTVPGLDAVSIGFGDLSLQLGHPGDHLHPEVMRFLEPAWAKVLASGKALQVDEGEGGKCAREWVEAGALLPRCEAPQFLAAGCKAWLQTARGQ